MDGMGKYTLRIPSIPMNKKPMCDWGRQLQSWSHQSLRSRRREKLGGGFFWCGKKGRKIPSNHRLDVENLGSFMGLAFFCCNLDWSRKLLMEEIPANQPPFGLCQNPS